MAFVIADRQIAGVEEVLESVRAESTQQVCMPVFHCILGDCGS